MARYALVVGVSENTERLLGAIPQAERDAEAIATLLETHGDFRVTRLRGRVTREALAEAFRQFWLQAANSEALIFYSGHGIQVADDFDPPEVVLAPSDCELVLRGNQIVGVGNGLKLNSLNQKLAEARFSSLVMILDCCHSGYLLEEGPLRQMFGAFRERDYVLLTACRSHEQAWALRNLPYSVLTGAVLEGLAEARADEQGKVTADQLVAFVKRRLRRERQEPVSLGVGREVAIVQYRQPLAAQHDDDWVKPYQGLNAFTPETARFFFGRDEVVQELLHRLEQFNFIPLIGSSGSGKSSVVRAKLVPRLEQMGWRVLGPFTPSVKPIANLIEALSVAVNRTRDKQRIEQLVETGKLLETIKLIPGGNPILLVIDQFEEIFTVCPNKDVQRCFLDLLLQVQSGSELHVVMTWIPNLIGSSSD